MFDGPNGPLLIVASTMLVVGAFGALLSVALRGEPAAGAISGLVGAAAAYYTVDAIRAKKNQQ